MKRLTKRAGAWVLLSWLGCGATETNVSAVPCGDDPARCSAEGGVCAALALEGGTSLPLCAAPADCDGRACESGACALEPEQSDPVCIEQRYTGTPTPCDGDPEVCAGASACLLLVADLGKATAVCAAESDCGPLTCEAGRCAVADGISPPLVRCVAP